MRTNPVLEVLLKSRGSVSKLGPDCYSWSLPPGVTCPGQTSFCAEICYAKGTCRFRSHVSQAWRRNLQLAERRDFQQLLTKALCAIQLYEGRRSRSDLPGIPLRIHVGGDFYSPAYTRAWLSSIYSVNSGGPKRPILPWAYTRIWRVPWLAEATRAITTRWPGTDWPQWLWCSSDPMTSYPSAWVHEAQMVPYPPDYKRPGVMAQWKRELAADKRTCPHLAARFRGQPAPTCQECGRCWDPKSITWRPLGLGRTLLLPQHR